MLTRFAAVASLFVEFSAAVPAAATEVLTPKAAVVTGYREALAARGAGRPDIAERILTELITAAPNNLQLRFELGVALAEQGQCAAAVRAFDHGSQMAQTPTYDRAVQAAMSDLCPGLAPFEFTLNLQVVGDSNVNSGATDPEIEVNGTPFTLSDDATARRGLGYTASGSIGYNYSLGDGHLLVPNASVSLTDFAGRNNDNASAQIGLAYRHVGERLDWRIGPALTRTFDAGGVASEGAGLTFSANYSIDARRGFYMNADYMDSTDTRNSLRDNERFTFGFRYVQRTEDETLLRAGITYTNLNYEDDFQDLASSALEIGASGALLPTMGYDISLTHTLNKGDQPSFLFGTIREDNVTTLSGAISFAGMEGWYGRPYLGLSHTVSDSNWATKDFERTRFLIGFTRRF